MASQLCSIFCDHPTITTDTREISQDSIFFALKGASFDGNDYAITALEAGAAYSIIDREAIAIENPQYADRLIVVENTLESLQLLANEHRRNLGITIIAISGSNGKTTTKELLASVLSTKYQLYATHGNLNNHIGVPLTLLAMDKSTQIGVVEMGASSCGEIELLCSIAEPNFGIITNIGRAHLEGFGGEEGVRCGKGELLDYLATNGGVAFVANENHTIQSMCSERPTLTTIEYDYTLADGVEHHLEGEYNRFNIAAAVAVGLKFDTPLEQIKQAIADYHPSNNRSQAIMTKKNRLILDCYNANPSSMKVAIDNFAMRSFEDHTNKILILGDMFELGEWSLEEHRKVVELALKSDATRILLAGINFGAALKPQRRIEHYSSRKELEEELKREPITDSSILIKGSRGVGLEKITILL